MGTCHTHFLLQSCLLTKLGKRAVASAAEADGVVAGQDLRTWRGWDSLQFQLVESS